MKEMRSQECGVQNEGTLTPALSQRVGEGEANQGGGAATPYPGKRVINVELLRKVKEAILAEPEGFDMAWWHGHRMGDGEWCGTTHCLAGWVQVLQGMPPVDRGAFEDGRVVLGLNLDQASRLFSSRQWPVQFACDYAMARFVEDRKEMARVAGERIEFFIRTNGTDVTRGEYENLKEDLMAGARVMSVGEMRAMGAVRSGGNKQEGTEGEGINLGGGAATPYQGKVGE